MSSAVKDLLSILDLERLEHNLFRGRSPQVNWQRVFGGQTIGQALVAAQRTVASDRHVHSLHGYFMRPGDTKVPIIYEVDRIRDGGSFTTRRVVAIQHGQAIFTLAASFHVREPGLDHQAPMPLDLPPPEGLRTLRDLIAEMPHVPDDVKQFWGRERPLEIRPVEVDHYLSRAPLPPRQHIWIKATGSVPDDWNIRSAVLAYLSDMTLLDTSTFPHGRALLDGDIQAASLDHAMWFHRSGPVDEWLLYAQDSPSASGACGFNRGQIYARDGTLMASVAQEGLIRPRTSA